MGAIQRMGTTQRFSDAVVHNELVYIIEVPPDATGDIKAQTASLLASVDALLLKTGSDRSRLLQVTIYLPDMADYDGMNTVWDAWVPAGTAPVRACIQAGLANPAYKVEMVVVAALARDD